MKSKQKPEQELLRILQDVSKKGPKSLKPFLVDLLSENEYNDVVKRWQLIKKLDAGIPQRQIAKDLHISISKVTRGSHALKGKGFKKALSLQK